MKTATNGKRARTQKPAEKPADLRAIPTRPGRNGGRLRSGNPGNKGGRPPNEFIDWCRDLLADPTAEKQVKAILRDKDHPAYATMYKTVTDRGYGRPTQPLHHSGRVPLEEALTALEDGDGDDGD